MALPSLFRRGRDREVPARTDNDPVTALREEMDRLFDDFGRSLAPVWAGEGPAFGGLGWPARAFSPSIEVEETESEVRVTAELPGLEEKDFELDLEGDLLVLRGEKRQASQDREGGWTRSERVYGRFERRLPLPCEVEAEQAKAEFRQGVLNVTLPKTREARERRVRIPIEAS